MTATANSWKWEPFKKCVRIAFHAAFDADQVACLKVGLIPRRMEDKWFVYYEEPQLFFHRGWSGKPVYRITLTLLPNGSAAVSEAYCSNEFALTYKDGPEYPVRLLDFLISDLLLGQSKPFPLPLGLKEPLPGSYQHHISGTGFAESVYPSKKAWWRFW